MNTPDKCKAPIRDDLDKEETEGRNVIDTSFQGLLFRFLVTFSGVLFAYCAVGLLMYTTDTFCKDEGWHMF